MHIDWMVYPILQCLIFFKFCTQSRAPTDYCAYAAKQCIQYYASSNQLVHLIMDQFFFIFLISKLIFLVYVYIIVHIYFWVHLKNMSKVYSHRQLFTQSFNFDDCIPKLGFHLQDKQHINDTFTPQFYFLLLLCSKITQFKPNMLSSLIDHTKILAPIQLYRRIVYKPIAIVSIFLQTSFFFPSCHPLVFILSSFCRHPHYRSCCYHLCSPPFVISTSALGSRRPSYFSPFFTTQCTETHLLPFPSTLPIYSQPLFLSYSLSLDSSHHLPPCSLRTTGGETVKGARNIPFTYTFIQKSIGH